MPAMMTERDRVREIVKELSDVGDLTSTHVRYLQHTDEPPYEPPRFVSRRSMMFRRKVGDTGAGIRVPLDHAIFAPLDR